MNPLDHFSVYVDKDLPAHEIYYYRISHIIVIDDYLYYYYITSEVPGEKGFLPYIIYGVRGTLYTAPPVLAYPASFIKIHDNCYVNIHRYKTIIPDDKVKDKLHLLMCTGEKPVISKSHKSEIESRVLPYGKSLAVILNKLS